MLNNVNFISGSFRGKEQDKMEMRRPKIDFPTPAVLMGLTDSEKFPTMSEFFGNKAKVFITI